MTSTFAHSEPLLADLATATGGITQASFSECGLTNGAHFPATSVQEAAYLSGTYVNGTPHCISVFVVMDDASAPRPGISSNASADFTMLAGADDIEIAANVHVVGAGGNLYRCWGITSNFFFLNNGVIRFAGQSGKAFRISGFQVNAGKYPLPYIKTTTSAV